jgi:hypothetical protein
VAGPRKIPQYKGDGVTQESDATVLVVDGSVFHILSENRVTVNESSNSYEIGSAMLYVVENDP